MNDNFEHPEHRISGEPSTYQTGSTKPPKNYTGVILVLLGLVILLGGIATFLGFTNLKLFRALQSQQQTEPNAIGFSRADAPAMTSEGLQTGLGFRGEAVSEFWHTYHQLPRGIFVQSVEPGSDAARQGLRAGDILVQAGGKPVATLEELQNILAGLDPTKPVDILIIREEGQLHMRVLPIQ